MKNFQHPSDSRKVSICLIAGEASGDAQGALLAEALKKECAARGWIVSLWGCGGRQMQAAGVETPVEIGALSAMGIVEVLSVYPRISAAAHTLQELLKTRRPDITVLIDYPGLNMRLMEDAYHLGSCVVYHIPPKVWAHGAERVARLRDCTYLVTSILPFEEKLLKRAGVHARFVGNPLRDEIVQMQSHASDGSAQNPSDGTTRVGLVPGSRMGEIERVFPLLVRAFVQTKRNYAGALSGIVPVASTVPLARLEFLLQQTLQEENASDLRASLELRSQTSLAECLKTCRYAWVCSGTAALETAFLEVPMSVVYKMHWLTFSIAKRLVRLPHISLVNLCAEKEIVPEFLQDDATPEKLSHHALSILTSSETENSMRASLKVLKGMFPPESACNAAQAILDCFAELPSESARRFHFKSTRDLWNEDMEWGLVR
ncbi:MAG: hypothetical protein RIR26_419 [Pseudomonadota bacterium]